MTSAHEPPRYPSIPYLCAPRPGIRIGRVLGARELQRFLDEEVVVEEKLDGANAAVYRASDGSLTCAGRSGPRGRDRADQFGRLRAWLAQNAQSLGALSAFECVYGEWLYRVHTLRYERLPDYFVVIDWLEGEKWVDTPTRHAKAANAKLACAPVLFRGRLGSLSRLSRMVTRSAFGEVAAEGLIVRIECDGEVVARAKWVRPDFEQKADDAWDLAAVNGLASPPDVNQGGTGRS